MPLQQRLPPVLGQGEHPGVERQPGQLAVAEAVVGQVVDVRSPVRGEVALRHRVGRVDRHGRRDGGRLAAGRLEAGCTGLDMATSCPSRVNSRGSRPSVSTRLRDRRSTPRWPARCPARSAAARSSAVSTSQRSPGPAGSGDRTGGVPGRRARRRTRGSSATPGRAVSSVVPVPAASATKPRGCARPRRSASASSAGRSAGRSPTSAATPSAGWRAGGVGGRRPQRGGSGPGAVHAATTPA